ncbi:MAG: HDOD domain-containing protein [Candidatus Sedimenticola sp. PURPLELP]
MDTVPLHPELETLRMFTPLRRLSREQLELLRQSVELEEAATKQTLIKRGSKDDYSFFLIEGRVVLTAADGKSNQVDGGSPSARSPLSRLIPHKYEVVSQTPVQYFKIKNSLLDSVTSVISQHETAPFSGYSVEEGNEEASSEHIENKISLKFLQDLESDKLVLPSLPDVAIRIGKALEEDDHNIEEIASVIQNDPVITAKLIKSANSAFYGMPTPVETCSAAVVRIGTKLTHKLVLTYALRELFKSKSKLLQARMKALWAHSTNVAAICYVLARRDKRFDPEHAMLAGLLHDIGIVAILHYAERLPAEELTPEILDQAIKRLRAQIGSLILRKWGFAEDFVTVALEAEEWMRNSGGKPDYCDLVVIAQLHSFVGTHLAFSAPAINQVPAHTHLALGELTPRMSLKILEEASDQIEQAEVLLSI